jgi:uncharacterized DUF497 family protein
VDEALAGTVYARRHRGRHTVTGRTADRILFIVLKPVPGRPRAFRVVSARDATVSEKRLFLRRARP